MMMMMDLHDIFGKDGNAPMNKHILVALRIKDPDEDPIRNPEPAWYDAGKTCLGGGMHCPGTSR